MSSQGPCSCQRTDLNLTTCTSLTSFLPSFNPTDRTKRERKQNQWPQLGNSSDPWTAIKQTKPFVKGLASHAEGLFAQVPSQELYQTCWGKYWGNCCQCSKPKFVQSCHVQWQHWPECRNSSHSLITFKHSLMQPSFPYFTKWIKCLFSNLCHSTPPNTHRVSTMGKHPKMATVLMNHIWFSRICTGRLVKKSLTFLKLSPYFSQGHISRPMAMADGKCKQHKCDLKEGNLLLLAIKQHKCDLKEGNSCCF